MGIRFLRSHEGGGDLMKAFFLGMLVTFGVIIIGGAVMLAVGAYNVAANVPHPGVTFWILDEARERSIAYHSQGIVPPPLRGKELADTGFPFYHASCRLCHGAPGFPSLGFPQGLYPTPPPVLNSDDVQRDLDDAEIYWVIKNGLKLTGLPAFALNHTDKEIRDIVAFLRHLPNLSNDEYGHMLLDMEGLREAVPPE
jgi:mono/diheme cytochrome c family protein